jgi:hypothetical protein
LSGLAKEPAIGSGVGDRGQGARNRDRAVAIYVALSTLLLMPGLLAAAHIGLLADTELGHWLAALDGELQHIAFGRTPRFWMGVAGATLMGLLLLYPLRKRFGIGSGASVAAWFHVHTMIGLLGPVLILYHCYFGTGSTPANVALFTTLGVAASGIFGHFVYARLSASFHGERKRAEDHLLDARTELLRLASSPSRAKFFDALEAFARQPVSGRRGLWRRSRTDERQGLIEHASWLIENQGPQEGWSGTRCQETAERMKSCLEGYFDGLARAARQSAWERVASAWRLLHLPLFCVTLVAIAIHVAKVWNMDRPPASVVEQMAEASHPGGQARPSLIATRKVTTTVEVLPGGLPKLIETPQPVLRAAPSADAVRVVSAPPSSATEAKPAEPDAMAELVRRTAQLDNTGTLDPATVLERLARFRKDPKFDHAHFPLTGKHASLGCESCHKTTLKDTPRLCVDCHKKDDVHRGRRPNCETCHATSDWDKIQRPSGQ